ncbi:MAG TPA: hypothetical protein VHM28_05580, partial [Anaerolineales bacterium]|nr:hypothetical protein [Anaerolineales bacterium]
MKHRTQSAVFASICLLALSGLACSLSLFEFPTLPSGPTQPVGPIIPTPTPLPRAQTIFTVTLPEPLAPGESLALSLVEEVTGLAFDPQTFAMQPKDSVTYTTTLALPYNAVVKYRYVRRSNIQILEDSALDEPIRYRLYYVAGQAEVKDILGSWDDKTYVRPIGSIQGRALNADT